MTVRTASPEDAGTIAGFNRRLARETESRILDAERVERGVRRILTEPGLGRYWLAEADGEVCGQCLVTVEPSDWSGGVYWWLQSVYVAPASRGVGVFRALWDHIVNAAREAGDVAAIRLYVEQGNISARDLYVRLGMSETGYRMYELSLASS